MAAPKMKKGEIPKTIKEAQPQPVRQRYAMAAGMTNASGTGTQNKKRGK